MAQAARLLGADGPFSQQPAFTPRPGQQQLAEAIEDAMAHRGTLVAEAATGIGKTWAYLVPALESGRRVVISTGTKNLQDQLFHRDLPAVQEALGYRRRTALLKGRANYLCRYRLEQSRQAGTGSRSRAEALESLNAWSVRTGDGDIAEVHWLPEGDPVWPRVTSTSDNCLGSRCPYFDDCFVYKARQQARAADVVVVNHDLLFAALALRRDGVEELLPEADAYVVDEAHKVPETAAQHFGVSFTSGQLLALADDALAEAGQVKGALAGVTEPRDELRRSARVLASALSDRGIRDEWPPATTGYEDLDDAVDSVDSALAGITDALEPLAEASAGLDNCLRRARDLRNLFAALSEPEPEWVHWYQVQGNRFSINRTPLAVSQPFSELRSDNAAWIFTSATLAVAGRFTHFCDQLGLEAPETLAVPSGFDYQRNGLLYLPHDMPAPGPGGYDVGALVAACLPVLAASGGRAFLLFTSYRALNEARRQLEDRLDLPVFIQGESPRSRLLARFRESGNGVLLGTRSFWEGVDVAGEALSVVIIDRLPFESPADPVFRMRERALREAGRQPFMEWQLPTAVITLKQGAGRLIRNETDRGVLMICDPRIRTKSYGRIFLESLPPMPVTDSIDDVQTFFGGEADAAAGD